MKFDREFYKSLDEAYKRWLELMNHCRNIHLIKARTSEFYIVCWEK